jgi:hypothetical protein
MPQTVRFEQYWPWELLVERSIDLTEIVRPAAQIHARRALTQRSPEIQFLIEQGYTPKIAICDNMASCYTTIAYTFDIDPADLTVLLLRWPNSRSEHPV